VSGASVYCSLSLLSPFRAPRAQPRVTPLPVGSNLLEMRLRPRAQYRDGWCLAGGEAVAPALCLLRWELRSGVGAGGRGAPVLVQERVACGIV